MDEIEYLGATSTIQSYNLFTYCEGNPVNMVDESGTWPKWLETTVKVASAIVVVAAVAVSVVAVTAYTAGTGTAAAVYGASILLGATLAGLNGGVANEANGDSYINGYVGGAVGGAIQSCFSKGMGSTIASGGIGVAVGTAITGVMNNIDPDSKNLTGKEIVNNACVSGIKAACLSSITGFVGISSDKAVTNGANGLMPQYSYGLGYGVKTFFGWVDDALVYA